MCKFPYGRLLLCLVLIFEHVTSAGHCVYEGSAIQKGGALTASRGECYLITCDINGRLNKIDCYNAEPRSGCYKSGFDLRRIYPQCCPYDVCPQDIDIDSLN